MRDPKRLEQFYKQLKNAHELHFPDWRFGQLMVNLIGWAREGVGDYEPVEDAKFIESVEKAMEQWKR